LQRTYCVHCTLYSQNKKYYPNIVVLSRVSSISYFVINFHEKMRLHDTELDFGTEVSTSTVQKDE